MSLTVPMAGTSAGSSASVQVATPDTGAAIADFGNVMAQVGNKLQEEQAGREMARARVSMMKGLQDLRLQYEQIGDPDALDRDFPKAAAELRDSIVAEMMPRNQADAGVLFEEIAFSHGAALGGKALDLRQSQKRVILDDAGSAVIDAATSADPETHANYLAHYQEMLDGWQADGTLTPEQANEKWKEVTSGSDTAKFTRLLSDDPDALIAGLESGQLGMDTDGVAREQWRARAVAVRDSRAAALAADEKRAKVESISASREVIKDGISVLRNGSDFKGIDKIEAIRADPVLSEALKPELDELADADGLRHKMPGFASMSLEGKKKARAAEAARPKEKGYEAGLLSAMDASIAAHEAAAKDGNIYSYAAGVGMKGVDPLPDPTDPSADLGGALKRRFWVANGLAVAGMTGADRNGVAKPAPMFTPEELESYGAMAKPDAPPKEKARLAVALASLGPNADRAARELGADPMMDWITGGIGNDALSPKLALEAFEGQRAAEQKQVALPPVTERRGVFFRSLSDMFGDGTGDGPDENKVVQAAVQTADAIYAYRTRKTAGESGNPIVIDEEAYSQIFYEVMGGSGTFGGEGTGGFAPVSTGGDEYNLLLPKRVSGEQVEAAFEGVSRRLSQSAGFRQSPAPALTDQDWAKMSPSGRPPRAGGKPLDAKTWSMARFVPVNGDVYELQVKEPLTGKYVPVGDDRGAPWAFSMAALLQAGVAE